MFSSAVQQDIHFSLERYLAEVGLEGFVPFEPSLQVLQAIVSHHLNRFNYDNETLYLAGKQPADERMVSSLKIDSIFKAMLTKNGGYCFQHLELIRAVLISIGFTVDRHMAKVVMQSCDLSQADPDRPKTHELIVIHLSGQRYIVDVGTGDLSLRGPLMLAEGLSAITYDQYRLSKSNDLWSLDVMKASEWFCLYRFFDAPVKKRDVVDAHVNLYLTSKALPIRDEKLFVAKTSADKKRMYVAWYNTGVGVFKSIKEDPHKEKTKKFSDFDETLAFAKKKFGKQ